MCASVVEVPAYAKEWKIASYFEVIPACVETWLFRKMKKMKVCGVKNEKE